MVFNAILFGLCKTWRTDLAIDCFAYMVSNGCMPDESTYIILAKGLAYEGYMDEAKELLRHLYSRGVLDQSLIEDENHYS
ncbi:hypothetical protein ACP70R_026807 [Stipagrostis hirtigluma subsp. patula]